MANKTTARQVRGTDAVAIEVKSGNSGNWTSNAKGR
jgi:hypothetical protein